MKKEKRPSENPALRYALEVVVAASMFLERIASNIKKREKKTIG